MATAIKSKNPNTIVGKVTGVNVRTMGNMNKELWKR